jgi:hypothetical protein
MCHRLYARAILHYIYKCFSKPLANRTTASSDPSTSASTHRSEMFIIETNKVARSMKITSGSSDPQESSRRTESSAISDQEYLSEMDNLLHSGEGLRTRLLRETEFLQDFFKSRASRSRKEIMKSLSVVDLDGNIVISTDFVTAVIELNRIMFNKHISAEDRRKVLFVSDQIIP